MLRAVIFDLDDTLVDQDASAAAAVIDWAAEQEHTGPDVVDRWRRVSASHYHRYQRREITFSEQRRARVRGFLGRDVDDELADQLFADYLRRYEEGWALFDDAVPALRRARSAGLTVAVFTNGEDHQQRLKIDRLGIAQEIDVLVASSTLLAGKPDPRAFAHVLEVLGVAAGEALMVGNSLDDDVHGALAAGLDAVLLDRADSHNEPDVPTIATLDDLDFDGR